MSREIVFKKSLRSNEATENEIDWTALLTKYMLVICSAFVTTACYFRIEHSWKESINSAWLDDSEYKDTKNDTADRLSKVDSNSTSARIVLAGWGVLCFFLRGDLTIRWNSWLLRLSIVGLTLVVGSLFWSENPRLSMFKLIVMGTVITAVVGISCSMSSRDFLLYLSACCLVFIGTGVLAEMSVGTFRPWSSSYRFVGTSHPNTLSAYAAFLCLASRAFWSKDSNKLIGIILLTVGLGVILMTKSRTTLGGVIVSMVFMQYLITKPENRIYYLIAAIFLGAIVSFGTLFMGTQSSGQLSGMFRMKKSDDVGSLSGRLPLWGELVSAIEDRPLLGYGYSAYWEPKRVESLSRALRWEIPHGHNCYLDILLDVGFIGFTIFILWLIAALATAVYHYRRTLRPEYAVVFGFCIFAMINALAESLFKLPTYLTFMLIGTISTLLFVRGEEAKSEIQQASEELNMERIREKRRQSRRVATIRNRGRFNFAEPTSEL